MAHNIICPQVGPNSSLNGWASFVKASAARGVPSVIAVTDTMSGADDVLAYGAPGSQVNYRPTVGISASEMKEIAPEWESGWGAYPIEVPLMHVLPSRDEAMTVYERNAHYHIEVTLRKMPSNLPLSHPGVTVTTWNEPAPYSGWDSAGVSTPDLMPFFEGWGDCFGWQAYLIGKELIRRKDSGERWFKWAAFAYAGGNPDVGVWSSPGMLAYLRLCSERPDVCAIALHEYSFTLDIHRGFEDKLYIGRLEHLHRACDENGLQHPDIFINEWGWEERDIPSHDVAMEHVASVSGYYAKFPNLKLAAIWTTQRKWEPASTRVTHLLPDLYKFTLNTTYPDPPPISPPTNLLGIDTSSSLVTDETLYDIDFGFQRGISWANRDALGNRVPTIDPMLAKNAQPYLFKRIAFGIYGQVYADNPEAAGELLAKLVLEVSAKGVVMRGAVGVENFSGETPLEPPHVALFLKAYEKVAGHKPIIYTSRRAWASIFGSSAPVTWAKDYPLWVAHYTSAQEPLIPDGWDDWDIWQYAGDVLHNGTKVDLNRAASIDGLLIERRPSTKTYLITEPSLGVVEDVAAEALPSRSPIVFSERDAISLGYPIERRPVSEPKPPTPYCVYFPSVDKYVTQKFAANPDKYKPYGFPGHEGVDTRSPLGMPFFAVADGIVVEDDDDMFESERKSAYGQHVVISHDNGAWHSLYAHAAYDTPVDVGDVVSAGDVIAYSGNTGNSTGPHCHFSILVKDAPDNGYPMTRYGRYVDPTPYMMSAPIKEWKPELPPPPYREGWLWGRNLTLYDDRATLISGTNFREGPGINYRKIALLPAGTVVLLNGSPVGGYYPVKAKHGATIDLLDYIRGTGIMYDVRHASGATETFQTERDGSKFYLVKNANYEEFSYDDGYIWRGVDTSPGPAPSYAERPGADRFYQQAEAGKSMARWCPRHMEVGQTYTGPGHYVQFRYKDTCQPSSANSGNATNIVRLIEYKKEAVYNGLTIRDVVYLGTNTGEIMAYAKGVGLVAWKDSLGGESAIFNYITNRPPLKRHELCQ